MIPGLTSAAAPNADPFGISQMFAQAAQNPEAMIPLLVAAGIEPPGAKAGVESEGPFAGMEFSSQSVADPGMRRDRVAAPPAGALPDLGGMARSIPGMIPTPEKLRQGMQPDMAGWAATPESMGVGTPPQMPFAQPDVFSMIPGGAPVPSGTPAMAPQGAPPMPGAGVGPANGNPFPTPIGTPNPAAGGAAQPSKAGTLADMLKGVKAPAAPEVQKVSTPGQYSGTKAIDQNSQIVALLTKMMSGQSAAPQSLRLGQALGGK